MTRLLVLRPEPGATATVEKARRLGLDAVAVPLFEVETVEWTAPKTGGFDGLLLTSANAARFGGEQLRSLCGLKAYAVGEATAAAAREAGFDVAATGDAGVERLLGSIPPDLKLLHLGGEDRHDPEGVAQKITALTVYRARPVERPELVEAEGSVALIHSPRSGRRFAELVADRSTIGIVAISPAAAAAAGEGWRAIAVAEQPGDHALLALAARLCDNSPPK
jgi:uroporphyrinogen-III synthase